MVVLVKLTKFGSEDAIWVNTEYIRTVRLHRWAGETGAAIEMPENEVLVAEAPEEVVEKVSKASAAAHPLILAPKG
jgi:hypothetical protein